MANKNNNGNYQRKAEVKPLHQGEKGQIYTLKRELENFSEGNRVDYLAVKIENNRLFVYSKDPILDLLKRFEEKQGSKHKGEHVKIIPYVSEEVSEDYEKLRNAYDELEAGNTALRGNLEDLTKANLDLEDCLREKENLEKEYIERMKKLEKETESPFKGTATYKTLESVLGKNDEILLRKQEELRKTYLEKQEIAWRDVFTQISEQIKTRKMYERLDELREAERVIKERDSYKEKYGENALNELPINDAMKEELNQGWKNAETTVKEAKDYIESIDFLEIPVRIDNLSDTKKVIILPVDRNSAIAEKGSSRILYDALVTYGGNLISEFGLDVREDEAQPFITLRIDGKKDLQELKQDLLDTFIYASRISRISIKPIITNSYFGIEGGSEKDEYREAENLTEEEEDLYPTLGAFIKPIIIKRYTNINNYIKTNNLPGNVMNILCGFNKGYRPKNETLERLFAKPLGVDLSLLSKIADSQEWK